MKRTLGMILIVWLVALLMLAAMPSIAQDVTPEAIPEVTSVVVEADELETGTVVMSAGSLIAIILAATAGGVTLAVLPNIIRGIRTNPDTIKVAEHIGNKVTRETSARVDNALGHVQSSLDELRLLLKEATDRIPAASKTPPAQNFTASGDLQRDMDSIRSRPDPTGSL